MSQPDFTGKWGFSASRSVLQIDAPELLQFEIVHQEPTFRMQRTLVMKGKTDTFAIELTTDGVETVLSSQGLELRARAYWEEESLVFDTFLIRAGAEGRNLVRYELSGRGDVLTARERFDSAALSYTNTWVLNRL